MKYDGIGYIRVSTKNQVVEGESLENQEKSIQSLLERKGCKSIKIYADEGISGRDYIKRDAFQEALKTAVAHKVKFFATYDTSRFARNTEQSIHFFKRLVDGGTVFLSATGQFDDTPEAKLMFSILASFDEYRSTKDGEKIKKQFDFLRKKA